MDAGQGDAPTLEVVEATIRENPKIVRKWLNDEPGSWGYLAGQAVLSLRQRLGRKLKEAERRQVWSVLWGRLVELKGQGP